MLHNCRLSLLIVYTLACLLLLLLLAGVHWSRTNDPRGSNAEVFISSLHENGNFEHYNNHSEGSIADFCSDGQHALGSWVESGPRNITPCCAWIPAEMAVNPEEYCGTFGAEGAFQRSEPSVGVYRGPKHFLAFTISCAATPAASCRGFTDTFVWKPSLCQLLEWNAAQFCQLLGNQTMLFIGDSTMEQTASSLMSNIRYPFWSTTAGCQEQIIFAPGDTLIGRSLGVSNRGSYWVEHVRQLKPDVVVLNVGAHIAASADSDAVFASTLNQVLDEHQLLFPELTVFWRSQMSGGCSERILDQERDDTRWAAYAASQPMYNYHLFRKWDSIARDIISSRNSQLVRFLDMAPLRIRADAMSGSLPSSPVYNHDCIHFCTPGPMDHLFLRVILQGMFNVAQGSPNMVATNTPVQG